MLSVSIGRIRVGACSGGASAANRDRGKQTISAARGAAIFMFVRQRKFAMLCKIDCIQSAVFFE
jgi:hypothetical protein